MHEYTTTFYEYTSTWILKMWSQKEEERQKLANLPRHTLLKLEVFGNKKI